MIIYLNGKFVAKEDAAVSVFDHGLLYGDGVFEGIRVYNGRVFRLDEHLRRLYDSAKSIMLRIPVDRQEMERVVLETVRRNGLRDIYIRLVITRGVGDLGLSPDKCPEPTVFCIADKIALYPKRCYDEGLVVVTAATRRNNPEMVNPRVKSLNYLNNILAKMEGFASGAQEVLLLNQEGYVVEATADNVFIVRDGRLMTPPLHIGALEGVTRNAVLELAAQLDIPAAESLFTRYDIFTSDECFLTGTGAEVIPVVKVDGRLIGTGVPGSTTTKLITAFHELTQSTGTPVYE